MMLVFAPKDPTKAYVSDRLWLPKQRRPGDGLIRPDVVKRALEFSVPSPEGMLTVSMWDESSSHVICPREFLPPSEYPKYRFPFVDLRPSFSRARFDDLVVPRNEEQARAWQALAANDNGILVLACGKGKTKLALKKIAQKSTPTLVVVPDGGILEQWRVAILGDPSKGLAPGLSLDGPLGFIQGTQFDWARPITLALVTTLWRRIQDGAIPEDLFRYFGLIVYDEVHQIGAPKFSLTAEPFYGDRIGLTATLQREDGLDPIYRYHIGEPFYSDLSQDLIPEIYFQKTAVNLPVGAGNDVNGNTNVSVLRSDLGRDLTGNVERYYSIRHALDQGRKVLCLSHSKDQLRLFHAMFPGSGLIVQETTKSQRMAVLRDSQVCFAISKLGSTGVDDDALDMLFWLTPFKSKIALQQSFGRVQRSRPGKKTPVVVIFEDWMCPPLKRMCLHIKSILREWSYDFKVTNPPRFPLLLPPEVQAAYDDALRQLPDRDDADDED
jgi:hypothetical protein